MKLKECLEKNDCKIVDLVFIHGIGDCIMFIPTVKALRNQYPSVHFRVMTIAKQVGLFKYFNIDSCEFKELSKDRICFNDGELYFVVVFNMSDGSNLTKNEKCCVDEIGIDCYIAEEYSVRKTIESKLVGIHFNNTCLPDGANPTNEIAHKIWKVVEECGLIPIEVNFIHDFHNPVNKMFDFVKLSTRQMECRVENMFNVMLSCRKFIGVNSGPFFSAMMLLGVNNVMMMEKHYKLKHVVRTHVNILDINGSEINIEQLKEFLNVCER